MKRFTVLLLLVGLVLALPLCTLAAEGDPANFVAVGETRYIEYGFTPLMYDIVTESLTPDIVTTFYNSITGVSPGMGTIRVTFSKPGITSFTNEYQVKVYPAPTSVTLSETSMKLGKQEIGFLAYTLSEGSIGKVTFSSDNPLIRLNQQDTGVEVVSSEPSEGNVTVTTYNGKIATCSIEVVQGPTGINLGRSSATMFVGQTLTLSSEATGGYTREGVRFSSSDKNVCTVSRDGVITAKTAGSAIVTAGTYNNHIEQCAVTVYDEPDSISLSGIRNRIGIGEEITFVPRDSAGNPLSLDLSFSAPGVLSIRYGKYITGEKVGTCTVTASSATKSATMEITVCPAPGSLTLSHTEVTLKETETLKLKSSIPEGSASAIFYYEDLPAIAKVSDDGVITAVKPGRACISAHTYNSKYAYCYVTVVPSELTYTLTPESADVGIGKTMQLRLTDPDGNLIPATYKSEVESTATVDNNGLVTGVWVGQTKIIAKVQDGREYEAHIKVITIPEKITVTPTSITLRVGQTGYYYLDSDASPYFDFTSQSSDPKVVRIMPASGASFEAVGVGTTTVTITSFNGKKATIDVTVLPAENVIAPSKGTSMNLGTGQTINMDVRDIYGDAVACTYVSSNPKVAKVDSKGNITGLNVYPSWNAKVTAMAIDGRSCEVNVYTYAAPGYLNLNVDSLHIPVGDTFQLVPRVQQESTTFSTVYSTNNVKVATVSKDGLVTAKSVGTCTITARVYNGKYDTVAVTVGLVPASVSISPSNLMLGLNESRKLTVTLPHGAVGDHFYLSTDPTIASIYDDVVTGLALGKTKLTVKTYNGKTANCNITVLNSPGRVTLSSPLKAIGVKQTVQLTASIPTGTASAIRYTSSNTQIATVNASGKVTGIKTGSVTLTATTYNDKKASITLQVKKAPSSIKLNRTSVKLGVGDALKLTATLSSGSAGTYTFASSNAKVATVDQNGVVKAIAAGKATITTTTYNGRKATCTLSIYRLPGSISVKSTYSLRKGRYFSLAVKFPSNTYSRVTFTSNNSKVATVDSAGKVWGVGRGTTSITVTATNGKTARCVVTVK